MERIIHELKARKKEMEKSIFEFLFEEFCWFNLARMRI